MSRALRPEPLFIGLNLNKSNSSEVMWVICPLLFEIYLFIIIFVDRRKVI